MTDPGGLPTTTTTSRAVDGASGSAEVSPIAPIRVDMAVELESIGVQAELGAEELDSADPFGTSASCSGGRRSFGPYSVWVSVPDRQVLSVAVFTVGSATQPGIHSADVRVELRSGEVESASGTVTIAAGWRSGTFVAFDTDGAAVRGSFECTGGDPEPAPLDAAPTEGALDSVEVVALLRRDTDERVVGLALDTVRSPGITAECPAAQDPASGDGVIVVRVDGDLTLGAISTFELTGGDSPTMRLRVGGVSYEFDEATITLADPAGSGAFTATADSVTVDGAFRCV